MKQHWLVRTATIRLLWVVFLIILAVTLVAGLFMDVHAVSRLANSFAFFAWYGLQSCIGMIIFAKLLGRLLQRKDTYYDRD
mgnify:FL=1